MATYNLNTTASVDLLSSDISASQETTFSIANPLSNSSYFTFETVRNSDGFYDSSSPKNMVGTYSLGAGLSGVIKSDYIASVIVKPGGGDLTFTPDNYISGSSLNLRGTSSPPAPTGTSFDADAQAFFTRVADAGGSLSTTEQTAVNTLVVQMKADGIWTKMKAIYPMVGASAASCAQNLKSSSFTGTFNGGVTFASTGVKGNGTTGYFDTNYNPVTDGLSVTSAHISAYTRQDETGNSGFGRFDRTAGVNKCLAVFIYESNSFYYEIGTGIATGSPATLNKGFHLVKSDGSTGKGFLNNVQKGSNFTAAGSFASANLRLLSLDISPFGVYYNQKECCFGSIGIGLSDTDSSNFYTAVQAFQTTLSRNV